MIAEDPNFRGGNSRSEYCISCEWNREIIRELKERLKTISEVAETWEVRVDDSALLTKSRFLTIAALARGEEVKP